MEPERFREIFSQLETEIKKIIVGHDDVIRKVLVAFFGGGHVLLEGVPGLGKTLLVKSMSRVLGLSFKRIQFTPDLMPSDIIGTQVLTERNGMREFQFKKGPIFAQTVLADEINRATPKTQSAVLEAMEEKQVTVFGETYLLDAPFIVLATQNPIELEGTYPLPEAQLDRFFFKLLVYSPLPEELEEILDRTTGTEIHEVEQVIGEGHEGILREMQRLLRQVIIAPPLEQYVVRLVYASNPTHPSSLAPLGERSTKGPAPDFEVAEVKDYIRFGASPRGAQAIILGAKGNALAEGRVHVSYDDIEAVIYPALRHRLILNFQGEAENVNQDQIIAAILRKVPKE
jgi:MoxR-like ATPase